VLASKNSEKMLGKSKNQENSFNQLEGDEIKSQLLKILKQLRGGVNQLFISLNNFKPFPSSDHQ
jgi:hypothetical protein